MSTLIATWTSEHVPPPQLAHAGAQEATAAYRRARLVLKRSTDSGT